jgi:hypothetical protein
MGFGRALAGRARRRALAAIALALVGGACGPGPATSPLHAGSCAKTLTTSVGGTVTNPAITEASGIVASRTQPGIYWVHNDSGDSARIFAIDSTGATRATYNFTGISAYDWEDIALGPGPIGGVDYLYVGDIGDNSQIRPNIQVYRVREPVVPAGTGTYALSGVDRINLVYPNGARNAESLLVDPRNGEITVVMKRASTEPIRIYRAPANSVNGSTATMTDVGMLALPGRSSNATGIDMSRDARTIVLRTYANVYTFNVSSGATVQAALGTFPCAANATVEPQGEAIAFHPDDLGFVTLSEGTNRPLNNHDV